MKELILRKTKDGRMTVMPPRKKLMTSVLARDVKVVHGDISYDYPVTRRASRELTTIRKKVSPQLLDLLTLQLMGFRRDMQYVMAENITLFAYEHVAYTTGCSGVDAVLDICYTWIAEEQGLMNYKMKELQKSLGL